VKAFQRLSATLFDAAMAPLESGRLRRVRRSLLRGAAGSVLEIGAGTGVNLRYYDSRRVSSLTLSDLDDRRLVLTERVRRDCPDLEGRVAVTRIDAQRLPFSDGAFDTVVATLLFCSVECPPCGLDEIARVLAPGGRYLFLEHVRPEHPRLARFFDSINPLWNGVSRGCNLNRDTIREMEIAGFTLARKRQDRNGVFVWGEARHDPER
jgi:ubiquinone/menaquinone biosynthesis C-methylase UbiE